MTSNQSTHRSRVYKFYSKNVHCGKSFTVCHFYAEGVSKRTVYNILRLYEHGMEYERKKGSGRTAKIFSSIKVRTLAVMFDNSEKVSLRTAAPKFKASKSWVHKVLQKKTKIRFRKKRAIPLRTSKQIQLAKTKCSRLIRKFSTQSFILDDESYFTLSHSNFSANAGFYTSDVCSTPKEVKYTRKKKFEEKVLVWIAIGPKGLSRPLIRKSGCAVNAKRYLDECIRQRLIPYIRANYARGEYVFWPDQASAHYAKIVLDHLNQKKSTL